MNELIIVRGGGDLATGTVCKLYRCGFRVLILETANPSAIRRNVSFCEAVYTGEQQVEDIRCHLAADAAQARALLECEGIALLVDPRGDCIREFAPLAVVDAILAKRNLGTHRGLAPITVALGPGFTAGQDVDAVIETQRGHDLGRVILSGQAAPNTGVPGLIAGYGAQRVIHSPADGILRNLCRITDTVRAGEPIAQVETETGCVPVCATIDGLLRGLLRDGYPVTRGFKLADIDPRTTEYSNCFTVSDKARCIAGGVVEAILYLKGRR